MTDLLHVDLNAGPTLDEETVVRRSRVIRIIALMRPATPADACLLILATLSDLIADTDLPIELLTTAIDSLTEERADQERKLARVKAALSEVVHEDPSEGWMDRVHAVCDAVDKEPKS